MISLVISLTTTPMMCAWLLPARRRRGEGEAAGPAGALGRARLRAGARRGTRRASTGRSPACWLVLFILVAVIGLNVYLFSAAPKGFFPQQDTGQLSGGLRADQSISSQAMGEKLRQVVDIIRARSGGRHRRRLHRRRPRRRRLHVRQPEAGVGAHRQRPGGDRAPAPAARPGDRPVSLPQPGAGRARRRPAEQLHLPVHAEERQPRRPAPLGDAPGRGDEAAAGDDRRRHRPAGQRRRDAASRSTATARRAWASRRRRRHRALQRASASARSRRSTTSSTSTTWSWNGRRATRRGPNALADVYVPASGDGARRRRDRGTTAAPAGADGGGGDRTVSANPGSRDASTGSALSNTVTPLVPLSAVARFRERSTPTSINHQDGELATTISFNLAEGKTLGDASRGDQAGRGRHRHADQRARRVPGHGAGGAAVAGRSRRC